MESLRTSGTTSCKYVTCSLALLLLSASISEADKCKEEHSWDNLDHFTEFDLVPKVIPCQPRHTATIYYNADDYVLVGNPLTKDQVKNEPTINFPALRRGTYYTAIMIDPDAPSRNKSEGLSFLHFLAVNSFEVVIGSSDIVASYVSPAPPAGDSPHRYAWLLYQQNGYIDPSRLRSFQSNRENFQLEQVTNSLNLSGPSSGNLFLTGYGQ